MSDNSKISWTHHTFNPWWGCVEVSAECDRCYAREWSARLGNDVWGATAPRRFFGERHWNEPLRWNRRAKDAGTRRRVFCASMADIAETHRDPATMARMNADRRHLAHLIEATDHLDWLLLTKRPQDLIKLFPQWADGFPLNVWVLVTVGLASSSWRLDVLCDELPPAVVKGVSYGPALGPVSFTPWFARGLSWVIAEGESNLSKIELARPSHPSWFRQNLEECLRARVPYHFKQWGEWGQRSHLIPNIAERIVLADGRSMTWADFKASGSIDETTLDPTVMYLVGKERAGRTLNGRLYDEFPYPERSPYFLNVTTRSARIPGEITL